MRRPIRAVLAYLVLIWLVFDCAPSIADQPQHAAEAASPTAQGSAASDHAASFRVSPNGAATFTIPIRLAPGTKNMQPSISLAYNSQGSNGQVGVGWGLSGLSQITRCGATYFADGFSSGVNYTANDRFCFDGARLMNIEGYQTNPYYQNGSVYHTEIESWRQVAAYAQNDNGTSCGSGPCWFEVTLKDGTLLEYGRGSGAQFLALDAAGQNIFGANGPKQGSVRAWALDKIIDRNGNSIVFTYTNSPTSQSGTAVSGAANVGDYYVSRIDYTANASAIPATVAQRSVQFYYTGRPDVTTQYQGGARITTGARLASVVSCLSTGSITSSSCTGGGVYPVASYNLTYCDQDATCTAAFKTRTGRSVLYSLTECGSDGASCLPPNIFTWQTGPNQVQDINGSSDNLGTVNAVCNKPALMTWADFNGDGLPDWICNDAQNTGSVKVLLTALANSASLAPPSGAQPDGTLNLPGGLSASCNNGIPQWTDFTGSGNVDWVCNDGSGYFYVLQSNGSTLTPAGGADPVGAAYPGRLKGVNSTNYVQASCPDPTRAQWADFNGDGYIDWICTSGSDNDINVYVLLSTGATLQTLQATTPVGLSEMTPITISAACPNKPVYVFVDTNGDGMADFTCSDPSTGTVSAFLSTGTSLVSANPTNLTGQLTSGATCTSGTVQWADINGDGLPDWTCVSVNLSSVWTMVGTGANLVNPDPAAVNPSIAAQAQLGCGNDSKAQPIWADFNGDGLADLICYAPSLSAIYYQLSSGTSLQSAPQTPVSTPAPCSGGVASWMDLNGDRLIDWVCTTSSAGSVIALIGSPPYPDLATTLTNSLGGQVVLSYAPLTDNSVYGETKAASYPSGEVLGFPQLYILDKVPLYVVASYTLQNNANRNQSGAPYIYTNKLFYTDGVVGLLGLGWQGFGSVTVYDATVGNNASIEFLQNFPFTGHVARTVACTATAASQRCANSGGNQTLLYDMRQDYYCETNSTTCQQDPRYAPLGANAHVAQVLLVHKTATHKSFGYQLEQTYDYDKYGNVTMGANLGDVSSKQASPLYTCSSYANAESPWLIGFVVNQKQSTAAGCPSQDAWSSYQYNAATDLNWQQTAYDSKQNVLSVLRWDNRNSDWLGRMVGRDAAGIGNITSIATTNTPGPAPTAVANTSWTIGYDATYSTFVARVTSPPATPGDAGSAFSASFAYDARFGSRVGTQGPNGEVSLSCADMFGSAGISQGPLGAGGVSGTDTNCLASQSAFYGATGVSSAFTGATVTTLSTTAWTAGSTASGPAIYKTTTTRTDWANSFANAKTQWSQDYIDGLGRPYRRINQGLDQNGAIDIQYLSRRRIKQVSLPYAVGVTPSSWISAGYDSYGRKKHVTLPYSGRDASVQPATEPCTDDPIATTMTICWDYAAPNTTTRTAAANTDAPDIATTQFQFFNSSRKTTTLTNQGGTAVTNYGFDHLGRPISVVDPLGATLTATRDSLGRPWTVTDTANGTTSTSYDPLGHLFSLTDAAGITTQFSYDGIGRKHTASISGPLGELADVITYSYDAPAPVAAPGVTYANLKGRLSGVAVAKQRQSADNSAYAYGYDSYGRSNVASLSFGGLTTTFSGTTTPLGAPSQVTSPDAAKTTVSYGYSNNGWPSSISAATAKNPDGATLVTYSNYTLSGQPQTVSYGNGDHETFNFTPLGQVINHGVWGKGSQVPNLMADSYVWTPLGQLAQLVDCTSSVNAQNSLCSGFPGGTASGSNNLSANYGYSFERLTSAASSPFGTIGYQYHSNGNLTQTTLGGSTTSYQYKSVGPAETYQLLTGSDGFQAKYDRRGNMVFKQTPAGDRWSFAYDLGGRLIEARKNQILVERYVYDYKGRRLRKLSYAADGKTVAATTDYAGTLISASGSAGSEQTVNLLGPSGLIGARSSTPTASQAYYFHRDPLNQSTRLVTDGVSGKLLSSIFYQPYGATAQVTPANSDIYRSKFQGHELDQATGLYYLGARYYDPAIGRFVTGDKQLGGGPYRQDALNRYAMVLNDPVLLRDPDGHQAAACAAIFTTLGLLGGVGLSVPAGLAASSMVSGKWKTTAGIAAGVGAASAGTTIGAGFGAVCYGIAKGGRRMLGARDGLEERLGGIEQRLNEITNNFGNLQLNIRDIGNRIGGTQNDLNALGNKIDNLSEEITSTQDAVADVWWKSGCYDASFDRSTRVRIEHGTRQVSDIRVGDHVWALYRDGEKSALYPVTRLHGRKAPGVLGITVGDQTIKATAEHPFKVEGRGWVKAMHLRPGDRLATLDGKAREVGKVVAMPGPTEVFNFEVDTAHSYFVSEAGVLVHNPDGSCSGQSASDSATSESEAAFDDVTSDVVGDSVEAGADLAVDVGVEVGVDTAVAAGSSVSTGEVVVGFLALLAL